MGKHKESPTTKAKVMMMMMKNELARLQTQIENEDLRGLRYKIVGFIECMNMFREFYGNYLKENDEDAQEDC